MNSIDPSLLVGLAGVLVLTASIVIFRYFRPPDGSGIENSKALQEALKDLSANQQQIVGSIKVITDTQTTSQTHTRIQLEAQNCVVKLCCLQSNVTNHVSSTIK